MKFHTLALLLLAIGLVDSSEAVGQSGSRRRPKRVAKEDSVVAKAIAESKKSGMPIFAVSTAKTCSSCASLLKTMSTDEALQPTLRQFVFLQIDVRDPDFPRWNRLHPRESNGTPAWHVITSRGRQVESGMGAPSGSELNQVLLDSLEKAGRLPSKETLQRFVAAATVAEGHLQAGRHDEALAAMMPVREEFTQFSGSLQTLEGGPQILQVTEKIAEQGREKIKLLAEFSAKEKGWRAALAIARAREAYGMLPALVADLDEVEEAFTAKNVNRKLYQAARDLLRAESLLASGENPKKAESALKKVIIRHANTEAAQAAAKLLTKGVVRSTETMSLTSSEETLREWTDSTGKYTIQASLVLIEGELVHLKRSNGKIMKVPISKLDQEAHQYLAEHANTSR